jgi:hypothetical protein
LSLQPGLTKQPASYITIALLLLVLLLWLL